MNHSGFFVRLTENLYRLVAQKIYSMSPYIFPTIFYIRNFQNRKIKPDWFIGEKTMTAVVQLSTAAVWYVQV